MPLAGLTPSAVVIVATARALKYNGGLSKQEASEPNLEALKKGIVNLGVHIANMRKYGVPVVVGINRFGNDTDDELKYIEDYCKENNAEFALSEVFAKGGEGGIALAKKVVEATEKASEFHTLYDLGLTVREKIDTIAKEIYRADGAEYTAKALKSLAQIETLGGNDLPVCVAKTQYSLSDDPKLLGKPEGFKITISDLRLSNGAGFVVAYAGSIMTMPGLPKVPAAMNIDVDENGKISGLF